MEHPAHGYLFDMPEDGRVLIDLMSENGDPVLSLVSLSAGVIAANDDGGERRNSRIERYLQAGTYLLEATTYLERDYQPLMADFTLVVNLVDEKAKQERFLLKIEETRTPGRVVAGQPFPVDFRIGNLGGGGLGEIGGSALVYVVGPRVFETAAPITASSGRWEAGTSYHTGAQTAGASSIEIGEVKPFEVTLGRPGPSWVFVAVITYDRFGQEVGFHGLWQNIMVLSGTPFDAVNVEVDGVDYVVEAVAGAEGLVRVSVSTVADPDSDVDATVRAKAIYAAGVRTQVLDGIFDQPALAELSLTGESATASVEGASSSALLRQYAAQYMNAVAASGLADSLAAEEALIPTAVEDLTLSISQAASAQFVSLAESWSSIQQMISGGGALSFVEALDVHSQFAYAERVISPAVTAGQIVAAARDADLGWEDLEVRAMVSDLAQQAACGDTEAEPRTALEETATADVDGLVRLAAEMRVASPIFGLANDAVLCAAAQADDENARFLQGLAIAGSSEIREALGYDELSLIPLTPASYRLRVIARLGEDGRIEHGVELPTGEQILPTSRFLATNLPAGRWKFSSDVEVDGIAIGKVHARRLDDGRTELSFVDASGETITPDLRYLAADIPVGV